VVTSLKYLIVTNISSQLGYQLFHLIASFYQQTVSAKIIIICSPSLSILHTKAKKLYIRNANLIKNDKVSCIMYLDAINRA